jgi:hypothetical protein
MKKRKISKYYTDLGKYCVDVSKVIISVVVIAQFVKNNFIVADLRQGIVIILGVAASVLLLIMGLILIHFNDN